MQVNDFSPKTPEVVEFLRHWRGLAVDGGVPGLANLDPIDFPQLLPFVWLCRWDIDSDAFVYRLAGEAVRATVGRPMRGQTLEQIFNDKLLDAVNQRYRRICTEPAIFHSWGEVYDLTERPGVGERLAVPLVGPSGRIDHVWGITVHQIGGLVVNEMAETTRRGEHVVTFLPIEGLGRHDREPEMLEAC